MRLEDAARTRGILKMESYDGTNWMQTVNTESTITNLDEADYVVSVNELFFRIC